MLVAIISASELPSFILNGFSSSQSSPRLVGGDDPRFSLKIEYGETKLPPTPVLMNAVGQYSTFLSQSLPKGSTDSEIFLELSARYAAMDFLGPVQQHHGIVLPAYQQVEIAVIPVRHATTNQVRLVIWAIYASVMEMVFSKRWVESEVEVRWEDRAQAHIYFTRPLDDPLDSNNRTQDPTAISARETLNNTLRPANAQFDWLPSYKPDAQKLQAKDVFLLALGAIKLVAPHPVTEKITGPFHVGSALIDANLQIYLHQRRVPRPVPPFFQYGHVLEAVRRIPGWELEHRRFAELFVSIEAFRRPVGWMMMEKGAFGGRLTGSAENVTTF